jgi:hypothetical protein
MEATDGVEAVEQVAGLGLGLHREAQHRLQPEFPGQAFGQIGLAGAGLAGQQQRHAQGQRHVHRGGQLWGGAIGLGLAQGLAVYRRQGVGQLWLAHAAAGVVAGFGHGLDLGGRESVWLRPHRLAVRSFAAVCGRTVDGIVSPDIVGGDIALAAFPQRLARSNAVAPSAQPTSRQRARL